MYLVCTNLKPYEICQLIATNSAFSFLKEEMLLTENHRTVDTLSGGYKAIYYSRYKKQAYNASYFCSTITLACDLKDLKHLRVKQATIFIRLHIGPKSMMQIRDFLDRNSDAYISMYGVNCKTRRVNAIKKIQLFSAPRTRDRESWRLAAIPSKCKLGRLGTFTRISRTHVTEIIGNSVNATSCSWLVELDVPRVRLVPIDVLACALELIVGRYIGFNSITAKSFIMAAMNIMPSLQNTFCEYQSLLHHDIAFARRLFAYIRRKKLKMIKSLPLGSAGDRATSYSIYRCLLGNMFGSIDHSEGIACSCISLESPEECAGFCVSMGVNDLNEALEVYERVVSMASVDD